MYGEKLTRDAITLPMATGGVPGVWIDLGPSQDITFTAVNDGTTGDLTCRITIDGVVAAENSGSERVSCAATTPSEAGSSPVATTAAEAQPPNGRFWVDCYDEYGTDEDTVRFSSLEEAWEFQADVDYYCEPVFAEDAKFTLTAQEREATKLFLTSEEAKTYEFTEDLAYEQMVIYCLAPEEMEQSDRAAKQATVKLCPKAPGMKVARLQADGAYIPDDGSYEVGKDIKAGTWRSWAPASDCYWERSSPSGDTLANDFVTRAKDGVTVTIKSSDGSFTTEGCGEWRRLG